MTTARLITIPNLNPDAIECALALCNAQRRRELGFTNYLEGSSPFDAGHVW